MILMDLAPLLAQLEGVVEGGSSTLRPRFSVAGIGVACQLASLAGRIRTGQPLRPRT